MVRDWSCIILVLILSQDDCQPLADKFSIKVSTVYKEKIKKELMDNDFVLLYEITPETYIVEYKGHSDGNDVLKSLSQQHQHSIIAWEPVRLYADILRPAVPVEDSLASPHENASCTTVLADSDHEVLRCRYDGLQAFVTITDVGINKPQQPLGRIYISFLDVNETTRNAREITTQLPLTSSYYTRVKPRTTSLAINSQKDEHSICVFGILVKTTTIALKLYELNITTVSGDFYIQPGSRMSIIASQAVKHIFDNTDIFVQVWSPAQRFGPLASLTADTWKYGATQGRHGLGTVTLFPSGAGMKWRTHNIYTVTVARLSSLRVPGHYMYQIVDASVLTSVLVKSRAEVFSSNETEMSEKQCVRTYGGMSTAPAVASRIVAVVLKNNPSLSQRDILHLLVKASRPPRQLINSGLFQENGAGLYVSPSFGLGLLNASSMIRLSKQWISIPPLLTTVLSPTGHCNDSSIDVSFCFDCFDVDDDHCITHVEMVEASVNLETHSKFLWIQIVSPLNTTSTLMNETFDQVTTGIAVEKEFVSTHFWEEQPLGIWKIRFHLSTNSSTELGDLQVTVHGIHRRNASYQMQENVCREKIYLNTSNLPKSDLINLPLVVIFTIFFILLTIGCTLIYNNFFHKRSSKAKSIQMNLLHAEPERVLSEMALKFV